MLSRVFSAARRSDGSTNKCWLGTIFEQHYRVCARPDIVLTIQRLHRFIQAGAIHRCLYLLQQMIRLHQAVYPYDLDHILILIFFHIPAFLITTRFLFYHIYM